jgi:hypothetical protein
MAGRSCITIGGTKVVGDGECIMQKTLTGWVRQMRFRRVYSRIHVLLPPLDHFSSVFSNPLTGSRNRAVALGTVTMAEVVGLLASVFTLAEVVVKVSKLVSLWDEVQNVPPKIRDLCR